MSSVAARLSPPAEAAYAATKAAISAWAECMKVDLRDTDVGIHVVYPGVIDTELFHLPGNDPLPATGVEMLPVDAMVEPVLGAIETGQFEVAVPDWFNGVFEGKYKDVSAFLDGTIAFVRSQPTPYLERTGVTSRAIATRSDASSECLRPAAACRCCEADRELAELAAQQHGVFTHAARPTSGLTRHEIDERVRASLAAALRRRVSNAGRARDVARRASRRDAWPPAPARRISHRSAGALYELPGGRDDLVELSCLRWRRTTQARAGRAREPAARRA